MKLVKADKDRCLFEIDAREKRTLFQVLNLYPLVPASHQKLSRTNQTRDADQQLLEEALNAQREENRRHLAELLQAKSRFRTTQTGIRFSIKHSELEWLLQVLNDIRVGSWLLLGSPEDPRKILAKLNEESVRYFWAMEVSGQFQMIFLHARNRAERAEESE